MTKPVSEHLEQARYFAWIKKHRRTHDQLHLVFAIPNGGFRHKAVAARMKAEGVEPGITDPPKTVDEARNRYGELQMSLPDRIEIIEKNKRWNVHHWGVKPWNLTGKENGRDPIHDG